MGNAAGLVGRQGMNNFELHLGQSFEGPTQPRKRRLVPFVRALQTDRDQEKWWYRESVKERRRGEAALE